MIILQLVKNSIELGAVIMLLLSVIAIFVSPAVDLEPTALRALQLANALFAILALAGTILTGLFSRVVSSFPRVIEPVCALLPAPELVDLNCTRLC